MEGWNNGQFRLLKIPREIRAGCFLKIQEKQDLQKKTHLISIAS